MDEFARFFDATPELARCHEALQTALAARLARPDGNRDRFAAALADIPELCLPPRVEDGRIVVSGPEPPPAFEPALRALMPWRKGPWRLLGIDIDTEWRSDWKWARLEPHITPLAGRRVLDVGTGNGYFLLRMLAAGAELAIGVDPTTLFYYQFRAIERLIAPQPAFLLPLAGEDLPATGTFDTVFSLGVLYHRRSPVDHVTELLDCLAPGGELVLETLIVPGGDDTILVPRDRYAQMRNVWFIPSVAALQNLLRRAGVASVRVVDVTATTTDEQRATDWMRFQSLADYLDPSDPGRTVEGYPAPCRAIVIGNRD